MLTYDLNFAAVLNGVRKPVIGCLNWVTLQARDRLEEIFYLVRIGPLGP